jgi:hypothetical protein
MKSANIFIMNDIIMKFANNNVCYVSWARNVS